MEVDAPPVVVITEMQASGEETAAGAKDTARGASQPSEAAAHAETGARISKVGSMPTETEVSPEVDKLITYMKGIYKKLLKLEDLATHARVCAYDHVEAYKHELEAIDRKRLDGLVFCGRRDPASGEVIVPAGQTLASWHLARCLEKVDSLKAESCPLDPRVMETFKRISGIKTALLGMLDSPTISEEDMHQLAKYQGMLDGISADAEANGGVYGRPKGEGEVLAEAGHPAAYIPAGQAACADLLEEAYDAVRSIQERSEGGGGGTAVEQPSQPHSQAAAAEQKFSQPTSQQQQQQPTSQQPTATSQHASQPTGPAPL